MRLILTVTINFNIMEGNYLTAGELALIEQRGGYRQPYGYDGYGCHDRKRASGAAITAVAIGSAGLAVALAAAWGVNQASKARARAAENKADGNAKTLEILAGVVTREANRNDTINLDVTQQLRNLTGATGGSATANAISQAEALSFLLNGGNGRNGQTCPTPVALYQPAMPCRCNTCGD